MIKLKDIPHISKEFKKIYGHYFDLSADPKKTIPLVEAFLEKYPYYPEAYNFMAVLLISDGQPTKAMKYIKALERIDEWRLHGVFDKAEVLIEKDKLDEGVNIFLEGIRAYLDELKNGIESFIGLIEIDERKDLMNEISKALASYLKNDSSESFENLKRKLYGCNFETLK